MRINARTWPAWVLAAATLWFVAITVFWATKPLVDRVPTTVMAVQVQGQPTIPVGARASGPTIQIDCGTPAESSVTNGAANAAKVAGLTDKNGKALLDPRFARQPCIGFHHQSRILWFVDIGLYLIAIAGVATVVARRRRQHHGTGAPAFASA
jgi:hypothetical protein